MSRWTRVALLAVFAAVVAAIASAMWWPFGSSPVESVALAPDDPEVVALGATVYAEHCASCHGTELRGQADWRQRRPDGRLPAPPHDATGHTWHHPDQVLFDLTRHGPAALVGDDYESDMPGYADILSDDEIVAVLSYIKSRWPPDIQARHDQLQQRTTR